MDVEQQFKNLESNLIQKRSFFKKLVDNMQVGVIVSDHEGMIVYVNDTYARFLGIDPKVEVGRFATDVIANSRLHIVARTGQAEVNYPHQFKDRAFLVHRIPIREDGKVIAVLGLVLFDSATTASKLAEKVAFLESKLSLYESELVSLRSTRYTIDSIIGISQPILALKRQVLKAAATNLPVLITGESGTGKELFAQAIHNASPRRPFPFVRLNCAAIPRELFESEFFGYEKGAFTGARSSGKPGKFELAHHGSIFLDEIGDLPLDMQPKLLRVLEEKEFEPVGGIKPVKADFRLLAATNHSLERMLAENRFRRDLFYRLNVVALQIPPLRERREDILPIARHLLQRITLDAGLSGVRIDLQVEEILSEHDWPGNCREISNVLERALSNMEKDTLRVQDLPPYLYRKTKISALSGSVPLKKVQGAAEREAILQALESCDYNKARTADKLGIHRSLLYKKIKNYKLPLNRGQRGG
jgi:PAS domain S-box-containing protein